MIMTRFRHIKAINGRNTDACSDARSCNTINHSIQLTTGRSNYSIPYNTSQPIACGVRTTGHPRCLVGSGDNDGVIIKHHCHFACLISLFAGRGEGWGVRVTCSQGLG